MWKYFFSWPVFWVTAAFLFNVITGVFGINSMTLRRALPFLAIGAVLAGAAAWQTAQQSYDQDSRYEQLRTTITGGDSYPAIVPQFLKSDGSVPLQIWNRGHSILTGVTVQIWEPDDFDPSHWKNIDMGTLPSVDQFNMGKPIPYSLTPKFDGTAITVDGDKVANYNIFMTAQNGMTTEVLQFKKGKCSQLLSRFWILKTEKVASSKDSNSFSQKILELTKWPDAQCK